MTTLLLLLPSPALLQTHASYGANCMRVFAESNGDGGSLKTPTPVQPELGVFNEIALRR